MKDVLPTLERWIDGGRTVLLATVIRVERSAPLPVGSTLALSDTGEIAGSVTGGCVEPAVLDEAAAVLGGGAAKVLSFGFADEESFELGLPCGGSVQILVSRLDPSVVAPLAAAIAEDRPAGLALGLDGSMRFAEPGLESALDGDAFVHAFLPRPRLYVLGAVDHASALARVAGFLGYRVTVADPRARFVTRERFPAADE